jgi:trehalose-6-phosphate synthase
MPTVTQPQVFTPPKLSEESGLRFALPSLNVISYRGPGESGGVSSSLEPMAEQLNTKVRWIALSGMPFSSDSRLAGFSFHQPEVPKHLVDFHAKACMEYLFPLLHSKPELARFDHEAWKCYRQLCESMATTSRRVAGNSFPTLVWLHDYQMAMVAPLLSLEAGVIVAQFWHVPWPTPEVIVSSPIGKELVEGLLANRLLGFHTTGYAVNFLNTVQEIFPDATVDLLEMEIRRRGSTTKVVVMPLGLDFAYWQRLAKNARPRAAAIPKKFSLANQVILGVDRIDYSKGVYEKLLGLEAFLTSNPGWHRRFHYVQLAQPPLWRSEDFSAYETLVKSKAAEINAAFGNEHWQPILWLDGHFEHQELAAWYQAADVLAVTPYSDGLNLIAKEYVACRHDDPGMLVLGRQAGAAAELSASALIVNSLEPAQIATALSNALTMPLEEKRRRMLSMRHVVSWNQLNDWAVGFLRQAITVPAAAAYYF